MSSTTGSTKNGSPKRMAKVTFVVGMIMGLLIGFTAASLYIVYGQPSEASHSSQRSTAGDPLQANVNGQNAPFSTEYNPPRDPSLKREYDQGYEQAVNQLFIDQRAAYAAVKIVVPANLTVDAQQDHPRLNGDDPATTPWYVVSSDPQDYDVKVTKTMPELANMSERIVSQHKVWAVNYSWTHDNYIVAVSRAHYDDILKQEGARNTTRLSKVILSQENASLLVGHYVPQTEQYYVIPIS